MGKRRRLDQELMGAPPFRLAVIYGLKTTDYGWLETFYPVRRLREECEKRSLPVDFFFPASIPAALEKDGRAADLFLLRGDIPDTVYAILETRRLPFVNSRAAAQSANDKLAAYRILADTPIEMPRLVTGPAAVADTDFPLIAKPRFGAQGRDIVLIKNRQSLRPFLQDSQKTGGTEYKDSAFIIQQFETDSFGRDLRVLFCNGKIIGCFRRTASEFRSNGTAGSKTEAVHLPLTLNEWTHIIMEKTGLFTGSADYLYSSRNPHGFMLCEINASPGFMYAEKSTGSNIAGAFADALIAYMQTFR